MRFCSNEVFYVFLTFTGTSANFYKLTSWESWRRSLIFCPNVPSAQMRSDANTIACFYCLRELECIYGSIFRLLLGLFEDLSSTCWEYFSSDQKEFGDLTMFFRFEVFLVKWKLFSSLLVHFFICTHILYKFFHYVDLINKNSSYHGLLSSIKSSMRVTIRWGHKN